MGTEWGSTWVQYGVYMGTVWGSTWVQYGGLHGYSLSLFFLCAKMASKQLLPFSPGNLEVKYAIPKLIP